MATSAAAKLRTHVISDLASPRLTATCSVFLLLAHGAPRRADRRFETEPADDLFQPSVTTAFRCNRCNNTYTIRTADIAAIETAQRRIKRIADRFSFTTPRSARRVLRRSSKERRRAHNTATTNRRADMMSKHAVA